MQLVVVGAHQRTAPVAIRERLAFPQPSRRGAGARCALCRRGLYYLDLQPGRGLRLADARRPGPRPAPRSSPTGTGSTPRRAAPAPLYLQRRRRRPPYCPRSAAGLDLDGPGRGSDHGPAQAGARPGPGRRRCRPAHQRLCTAPWRPASWCAPDRHRPRQLSVVSVALQLARQTARRPGAAGACWWSAPGGPPSWRSSISNPSGWPACAWSAARLSGPRRWPSATVPPPGRWPSWTRLRQADVVSCTPPRPW